jgi:hypothetical protein
VLVRLLLGLEDPLHAIQNLRDDYIVNLCLKLILVAGVCEILVPHLLHVTKLLWAAFLSAFDAVFDFIEHARDRWRSLRSDSAQRHSGHRDAA